MRRSHTLVSVCDEKRPKLLDQLPADVLTLISYLLSPESNYAWDSAYTSEDLESLYNLMMCNSVLYRIIRPIYMQCMMSTVVLPPPPNASRSILYTDPLYTRLTHTLVIRVTNERWKDAGLFRWMIGKLPLPNLRRVLFRSHLREFGLFEFGWLKDRHIEELRVSIECPFSPDAFYIRSRACNPSEHLLDSLCPLITPNLKSFELFIDQEFNIYRDINPEDFFRNPEDFFRNTEDFAARLRDCVNLTTLHFSTESGLFSQQMSYARCHKLKSYKIYGSPPFGWSPSTSLRRHPTITSLEDSSATPHWFTEHDRYILPDLEVLQCFDVNIHHYLKPLPTTGRQRPLRSVHSVQYSSPADNSWLERLPPTICELTLESYHRPTAPPPLLHLPLLTELTVTEKIDGDPWYHNEFHLGDLSSTAPSWIVWARGWYDAAPSLRHINSIDGRRDRRVRFDRHWKMARVMERNGRVIDHFCWDDEFRHVKRELFSHRELQRVARQWKISLGCLPYLTVERTKIQSIIYEGFKRFPHDNRRKEKIRLMVARKQTPATLDDLPSLQHLNQYLSDRPMVDINRPESDSRRHTPVSICDEKRPELLLDQLPAEVLTLISYLLSPESNLNSAYTSRDLESVYNLMMCNSVLYRIIRPIYTQCMMSTVVLPPPPNASRSILYTDPFYTRLTHTLIIRVTNERWKDARLFHWMFSKLPLSNLRRVIFRSHLRKLDLFEFGWLKDRHIEELKVSIERPFFPDAPDILSQWAYTPSKHLLDSLCPLITPNLKSFELFIDLPIESNLFLRNFTNMKDFAARLRDCVNLTTLHFPTEFDLFIQHLSYARWHKLKSFWICGSPLPKWSPSISLRRHPTITSLKDSSATPHWFTEHDRYILPDLEVLQCFDVNIHHYLKPLPTTGRQRPLRSVHSVQYSSQQADNSWLERLPPTICELILRSYHPPTAPPPLLHLPLLTELTVTNNRELNTWNLDRFQPGNHAEAPSWIVWARGWYDAAPSLRHINSIDGRRDRRVRFDRHWKMARVMERNGRVIDHFCWDDEFRHVKRELFSHRELQRLVRQWKISLGCLSASSLSDNLVVPKNRASFTTQLELMPLSNVALPLD
ncbi:hypothetical protein PROFUN_08442 [Planoprotostelium fungivorum]|uniref:Uncharacterized protein n=1 Tax=Planoprotostelium fungivorum TaxID=1890364 RepID=A0A2P6NJX0_9EUKA|nr:hypothetical protein PROFUN_08442 [Planoprotostelium fungivorum]